MNLAFHILSLLKWHELTDLTDVLPFSPSKKTRLVWALWVIRFHIDPHQTLPGPRSAPAHRQNRLGSRPGRPESTGENMHQRTGMEYLSLGHIELK